MPDVSMRSSSLRPSHPVYQGMSSLADFKDYLQLQFPHPMPKALVCSASPLDRVRHIPGKALSGLYT